MSSKKILLSGIQPSGRLHIGNYFGAMKQFVDLQDTYDTNISIVNYHALTTSENPQKLKEDTVGAVIDHLAIGLDPGKVTLFMQSDVPQITELTWIFNTLITVPYLSRAVAYKDKVAQGIEASVGLFDYPVLMASDILISDAQVVPVGSDQKQHVEMSRDIAQKFNKKYGDTFLLPEVLIQDTVATVPGIDGRKMSKSYNNSIYLSDNEDAVSKKVMTMITDPQRIKRNDPGHPEVCIVYAFHRNYNVKEINNIAENCIGAKIGCTDCKRALVQILIEVLKPVNEKRNELLSKNYKSGYNRIKDLSDFIADNNAYLNLYNKLKDINNNISIADNLYNKADRFLKAGDKVTALKYLDRKSVV